MEGEPEAWTKARQAMAAQMGSVSQLSPAFHAYSAGMYGPYAGQG